MTIQHVNCSGGDYDIVIDAGSLGMLGELITARRPVHRALLVADSNVVETHAAAAADALQAAGLQVSTHVMEAQERNKTLPQVESIWAAALEAGLDRSSCMIAVGGGLVGDVTGFAASSYLRGIDFVQVPTTMLAMVDASVGGKTGINLTLPDGGLGKNLAGAFWQPKLVLADPGTLATLPVRERRCGLAEMIKHAIIGDPQLLEVIESAMESLLAAEPDVVGELVARAVKVKVAVVEADEREHGTRALLNLGHTFAHAIEPDSELDLKHGEAVAIGLVAAVALSRGLGCLEGDWEGRLVGVLDRAGLPTRMPLARDPADLLARMRFDKKIQDGRHRLIVPIAPGQVQIMDAVPESSIIEAWQAVID